jgi:hypothetical protein
VVLHTSAYIQPDHVGRSWGCPAIRPQTMATLEKAGLSDAMLWIDAPDPALGEAVAACAHKDPVGPIASVQACQSTNAYSEARVCQATV